MIGQAYFESSAGLHLFVRLVCACLSGPFSYPEVGRCGLG